MTLEELQAGKVFLIDKPLDWTSFDVVNKLRYKIKAHFKVKKIKVGHAGTLDPKATGLLIICAGKATKDIQVIQDAPKVYTGIIKLGAETASYDTESEEINHKSIDAITEKEIHDLESFFQGEYLQTPPIFSAIKKEGRRLYKMARQGVEVTVPPRMINFIEFKITDIDLPFVSFKVHCSKGTYIRSMAYDAGEKLGCGGYLYALRRENIGEYSVQDADPNILLQKDYFDTI